MSITGSASTVAIHETPVLVVGAGPAGLVTAISLAHHGVRSLVIERHPSTSIFPRATGVSLRSMEIFRGFGIEDEIRAGGWHVTPAAASVRTLSDPSPVVSALGFADEAAASAISPSSPAVSPQDHIEPVLVEHYRSLGHGEIRFSTELEAIAQDASGVTATVIDRATGGRSTIRARYLVAADGHRSTVRDLLGIAMEGPDDLGQYLSILFRADLRPILGDTVYGLYMLPGPAGPSGPPRVVVPSGADGRFVLGIPLPPHTPAEQVATAFPAERQVALVREAAGRDELEVELLASNAFAFAGQVAARWRDGRTFLVGDAAHRMTPRGGRGMNTAIADAFDLGWKLAWVIRGLGGDALLDSYETERGPIGRRNVAMSLVPGNAGSDDGVVEELGVVVRSATIVEAEGTASPPPGAAFRPVAIPGSRAPHAWLGIGDERISTLDLFGRELVVLTAGDGAAWRAAVSSVLEIDLDMPIRVRSVGRWLRDLDGAFATAYGLPDGGAVLVRPDGVVAWRCDVPAVDPARLGDALVAAVGIALGRIDSPADVAGGEPGREAA